MSGVKFERVSKAFGKTRVVDDISMEISDGEFMTFVGPSGCGKSTTLRMVAGLEEISSGTLTIGGIVANDIPPRNRNVAMVFQSYALFPHMTVEANIGFGLKVQGVGKDQKHEKIQWALELLDLQHLARRLPKDLSGGERQRVALGRALVLEPQVLLLDEPLSNLDAGLRTRMRTALKKLHRKVETTIIYVTHDQMEAMTLSDRIAVMSKGRLMQVGTPVEVYNNPQNLFVASFIGHPPMNQVTVRITEASGEWIMDNGDLQLPLPPEVFPPQTLEKSAGKEVIAGLRAEHITLGQARGEQLLLDAKVVLIEPLGGEDILDIEIGSTELKMKSSPDKAIQMDDSIQVAIDLRGLHLFDRESEESLRKST